MQLELIPAYMLTPTTVIIIITATAAAAAAAIINPYCPQWGHGAAPTTVINIKFVLTISVDFQAER